jgi:N-methylhydantoinase A
MLDIQVIGAGGGSIAAIDDAGALKVGPRSAGADPGPVAYGRGGTEPTITDANLCSGGSIRTAAGRADACRHGGGARPSPRQGRRAAGSVAGGGGAWHHPIANANMSRAIRSVSVERGYDIGDFALCAFGGAGPLHAAEVAVECGIPRVLAPREPGTLCARGMLLTISAPTTCAATSPMPAPSWHACWRCSRRWRRGRAWLARKACRRRQRRFRARAGCALCRPELRGEGRLRRAWRPIIATVHERFHAAHRANTATTSATASSSS